MQVDLVFTALTYWYKKKVNKQNLYFERIICFKAETEDANSYIFQTFC